MTWVINLLGHLGKKLGLTSHICPERRRRQKAHSFAPENGVFFGFLFTIGAAMPRGGRGAPVTSSPLTSV